MSEAGSSLDNFDDEQDSNRFTIQPYQFEPLINSDEAGSLSSEESMESDEEAANPRLENSDWYLALLQADHGQEL